MDISDWGKPSPKDVYLKEAEQWLTRGKVPDGKGGFKAVPRSHKEFVNAILVWFAATYPNEEVPADLTVTRNSRPLWQRYLAKR